MRIFKLIILFLPPTLIPNVALACACGCGIFDVGTNSMFPQSQGGTIFEEYDFMDQDHNWSKSSRAYDDNNSDKEIKTSFINTGFQYMFDRSWGVQVQLPYDHRYFKTTGDDTGDIAAFTHSAVGDLRIKGIYTGFSADMSTGLTFGLKVPTSDWTNPDFDRDTEIGSGSTDALIGAFHRGSIIGSIGYFIQDELDQPFLTQGGYLPGTENDTALGLYYQGLSVGNIRVTPVAELKNSYRSRDRGWAANTPNSGYERLIAGPALEVDYKKFMVYVDIGFPIYQYINGNQLTSSVLYKLTVSYMF